MPRGIISHNDKCVTPHIYSYSELAHFKITMQTLSVTYDGHFWIYERLYYKYCKAVFLNRRALASIIRGRESSPGIDN